MKYPKQSKLKLSNNFSAYEFDCPCDQCTVTIVIDDLVDRLQMFRDAVARPVTITSGYRCSNYQLALKLRGYETAVGLSTHELGEAVDLMCEGMSGKQMEPILAQMFSAIGIGHSFCHVDLRDDKERRWSYVKR